MCVFSSVAGDRGRKPVALYGSSKAGLSHYLESLDHKYRAAGLVTVCVKPGFVKTAMTQGLKPPPFAGDPGGERLDKALQARLRRALQRPVAKLVAPDLGGDEHLLARHAAVPQAFAHFTFVAV